MGVSLEKSLPLLLLVYVLIVIFIYGISGRKTDEVKNVGLRVVALRNCIFFKEYQNRTTLLNAANWLRYVSVFF